MTCPDSGSARPKGAIGVKRLLRQRNSCRKLLKLLSRRELETFFHVPSDYSKQGLEYHEEVCYRLIVMSESRSLPSVALAGASGHLGKHVLSAFLSPTFRSSFSDIIILKRRTASPSTDEVQGATIRFYDDDHLDEAMVGIDVVVSTVGPGGHGFKDKLLRAVANSQVKLYIPSEFGVDHYIHDFPHAEWDRKKHHFQLANEILSNETRVCRVFNGLFLEDSIGPWFGFDTARCHYEIVGSAETLVSYTSLGDVGSVVAQLARKDPGSVPAALHIAGVTLSVKRLASIMQDAGSGVIEISELDLASYKAETVKQGTADPSQYLRFLMGEGKINHTAEGMGNDNELVNPNESNWKWKTMGDYAKETGGVPWADFKWSMDIIS